MDALQFAYWLRGFYEINGETALTKEQSETISKHLTLVFEQRAKDLPTISKAAPAPLDINDIIGRRDEANKWVGIQEPSKVTVTCESTTKTAEDLAREFKEALTGFSTESAPYTTPPTISCCGGTRYC